MNDSKRNFQPLIYALLLAVGMIAGMFLRPASINSRLLPAHQKLDEIMSIIREAYVDSVDASKLETDAINELLSGLDPHSVYIPAEELRQANEPLEGNFEGIGVEFNILNDTIMVVSAISGGPSEQLGIQAGDRFIQVDTTRVAGVGITSERVIKLLRGKKNSEVKVYMFRPSTKLFTHYTIVRNTIPIHSVDASFMLNKETGYLKVSRFAATTHDEFKTALQALVESNAQNLILDLRGNPGGYMSAAIELADELLPERKLVVYTYGRTKPTQEYTADKPGLFENGKLIVLVDEGSASASEILSGAIQDWDRGLIVGRRSFGKGLVQEPFELSDGSALRLTVSRYYTPSGRCIQKDYKHIGSNAYEEDILNRYSNGELEDSSKAVILDSTVYKTKRFGRIVYGGGGIYPDVFVGMDTGFSSAFLSHVVAAGLMNKFAYEFTDNNRKKITAYIDEKNFDDHFQVDEKVVNDFVQFCLKQDVTAPNANELRKSGKFIRLQLKALIARQIWHDNGYYRVTSHEDRMIIRALEALEDYEQLFQKSK